MADRQLPLEPTERIDPLTQATRVPGHDAVCVCAGDVEGAYECRWPWCTWKPIIEED